ncbi:Membrane protein-like protein involved in bacteriocin uptake [Paenibacillus vortex V453]|uniref:Membrane protein-like protein involved in bacteriocin uptake n=1 Tax=Paenibacillus vortex V453 TaxID=715225 RepID=A0A2R9SRL8_9BACL|nr:serine/threonine protein kinase [Paenibacillus vortex]EFU39998.1 Membrane protein-like protein involved in bacteriocin uptake [Paenibacillus vortex V453]
MTFQPNPGDGIVVNGRAYTVGQHPAAPGVAYAQAGRQGIVYQLIPVDGELHEAKALKVFFPKFRIPAMVYQSEHMGSYREIPGLQVSSREVLTPERNGDLIAEYPDLLYAVIMPWIHGCTWFDVISDQRNLGRSESLMLAKALAAIGSSMEQRGLAHCDLSAPNVMLPFFSEVKLPEGTAAVELVDVEQMYSPKMDRPDVLLAGSPGYAAHRTVHSGLWSAYADRFAGAVIIAEMLGWSDSAIVNRAWGESYFDQHEMQTPCERYFLLKKSLGQRWGARISDLFGRAWDSQDLSSCPTFGEWLIALSTLSEEEVVEEIPAASAAAAAANASDEGEAAPERSKEVPAEVIASLGIEPGTREVNDNVVGRLFHQARDLEKAGNLSGALEIFRSAYHFVKKDSPLEVELAAAIQGLEEQLRPVEDTSNKGFKALLLSRKFMISSAAALVILAGSAITVNQILAEKAESRQMDAEALAEQQAQEAIRKQEEEARRQQEEAAKKEEEAKIAEAERLKEEEAKKSAEAEQARKEQEKADLQAKYDKQAKYDAYLASVEEKKKKQELQEKYDNQAKYEAYLAQQEENKKKAAQDEAAAKAAAQAAVEAEANRKAQAKAAQQAQAAQLQKQRSQNVVELVALYNKAYNAQVAGNKDRARNAAHEFINLYNKDQSYYKTVGKMSSRRNNLQKFMSDDSHWIPKL